MKKLILTTLSLTITSAFAATASGTVTSLSGVVLDATGQALNSNGSCDSSNCSVTTTFPGAGATSGTTLLSQAVTSTETQTISCVAAGHPATWTGSATQTRSYTSQNGVKIAGTETAWVTTANTCVPPVVVAPFSSGQNFTINYIFRSWTHWGSSGGAVFARSAHATSVIGSDGNDYIGLIHATKREFGIPWYYDSLGNFIYGGGSFSGETLSLHTIAMNFCSNGKPSTVYGTKINEVSRIALPIEPGGTGKANVSVIYQCN